MYRHYGWTRTAFVEPLEYNPCSYATASVQETFSENDIFIAETATVDEVHITDKQLSIIVSNLKERARSKWMIAFILLLLNKHFRHATDFAYIPNVSNKLHWVFSYCIVPRFSSFGHEKSKKLWSISICSNWQTE